MKKIIKRHKVLFGLILVILYFILGKIFNIYLFCPFHEVTGLHCPGCGVTRMIKAMFNLNFYQAFRFNPLLFIASPFILFLIIEQIYSAFKNKKSLYKKIPNMMWNICLVILLFYWVLRNIIPYLAPTVV